MRVRNDDELRNNWPDGEAGIRCRDIVVSFLTERLKATALGADCNAVSAQGEAAANKAFASLIFAFESIGIAAPAPPKPMMRNLNRHSPPAPDQPAS